VDKTYARKVTENFIFCDKHLNVLKCHSTEDHVYWIMPTGNMFLNVSVNKSVSWFWSVV